MNHQQIDQLVKTFNIDTAKPPKAKNGSVSPVIKPTRGMRRLHEKKSWQSCKKRKFVWSG